MRIKTLTFLILGVFMAAVVFTAMADEGKKEEAKHDYIGAKKCRICHKKDGTFPTWSETAHATAFDNLTDEQKKDKELLKYYTTGVDAKGNLLEGVQCEACHGPGSDYKKKSIMEDRELAIKNGLLIPDAETCKQCHHPEAPEKLAALLDKDGNFDYEAHMAKGIHALPTEDK